MDETKNVRIDETDTEERRPICIECRQKPNSGWNPLCEDCDAKLCEAAANNE